MATARPRLVATFAVAAMSSQPLGGSTPSVTYQLDGASSQMLMRTFTEGILSTFAPDPTFAFTSFSGTLTITPGSLVAASFLMRTRADSVRLVDEVSPAERRERERMLREDILETYRYPEMVYRSTDISVVRDSANTYQADIEGTLTQHGVTRPCPMTVRVTFPGGRDRPGDIIRLSGEFSILQSQYNIKPRTFAWGTVRAKDRVVISFDLIVRRE